MEGRNYEYLEEEVWFRYEKNGADIPVTYFTEVLAEALGVKEAAE